MRIKLILILSFTAEYISDYDSFPAFLSSPNLTFFPLRGLISVFLSVWAGFPKWYFRKALVFVQLVLLLQVFQSEGENINMLDYLLSVLLPLFQSLQTRQKLYIFSGEGNSGQFKNRYRYFVELSRTWYKLQNSALTLKLS